MLAMSPRLIVVVTRGLPKRRARVGCALLLAKHGLLWIPQAADFGSMTTKDLKATVRATIRGLRDANFGAWFAELGPYVHPSL
jgi:hypothetical protein